MTDSFLTRLFGLRTRGLRRGFRIEPGQAVTLPRRAGVLRITEGSAWLTCESGARSGVDHVLARGQAIALEADAHAVFECARPDRSVCAVWEPRRRDNGDILPQAALPSNA